MTDIQQMAHGQQINNKNQKLCTEATNSTKLNAELIQNAEIVNIY